MRNKKLTRLASGQFAVLSGDIQSQSITKFSQSLIGSVLFSCSRFPFVTELVDKKRWGRTPPKEQIFSEVTWGQIFQEGTRGKIFSEVTWGDFAEITWGRFFSEVTSEGIFQRERGGRFSDLYESKMCTFYGRQLLAGQSQKT